MNLTIDPTLTTTVANDRLRRFTADAEVRRIHRTARRARRLRRITARPALTAVAPLASTTSSAPAPTILASSDFEHASARVA